MSIKREIIKQRVKQRNTDIHITTKNTGNNGTEIKKAAHTKQPNYY